MKRKDLSLAKGTGLRHRPQNGKLPVPQKWVRHYRALSLLRERVLREQRAHLDEARLPVEDHDLRPANGGSDEAAHEMALSRLEREGSALHEIDAAVQRILSGQYGICELTGDRIPAARLNAIPWTRFCEKAAAQLERQRSAGRVSTRPPLVPCGT